MSGEETICAVSTPPGEGGIGIIRISGRDAIPIADSIFRSRAGKSLATRATHTLHYGWIVEPTSGVAIDEVLVSLMRAPATYTREDVVEINCHGGMMPLLRTMRELLRHGARQADPGEFTRRAFLNGRIDLAQAESVMDIIRARTEQSLRAATEQLQGGLSGKLAGLRDRLISILASVEAGIDFPEEDDVATADESLTDEVSGMIQEIDELRAGMRYGRILRDGCATAIVGKPNVGKSSLLNALVKQDRAIVTEIPGTTRDVLEEYVNVAGMLLRILDTAGIRHTQDVVEREGVRRSLAALETADIALIVLDGSQPLAEEDRQVLDAAAGKTAIAVVNKSDLPRRLQPFEWPKRQVEFSCASGAGIPALLQALADAMNEGAVPPRDHAWAINQRHATDLEKSRSSLEKALGSIGSGMSPEFIAVDLRDGLDSLGMIIGAIHTDDILERIFSKFCIGK